MRLGAVRTCFADDTHAFEQAEQQAGGGRGLDAIGQLSRCLRAAQLRGTLGVTTDA